LSRSLEWVNVIPSQNFLSLMLGRRKVEITREIVPQKGGTVAAESAALVEVAVEVVVIEVEALVEVAAIEAAIGVKTQAEVGVEEESDSDLLYDFFSLN